MKYQSLIALTVAAACLTGCVVGPTYVKPPALTPVPEAFKEPLPATFKETDGWKVAQPKDEAPRGKWWEIFGDPQLNSLEEQVEVANQSLKASEARFREARAAIGYNRAATMPQISTSPSITGTRPSGNRPNIPVRPSAAGDFVLPFDLNYEIDFWGRIRRSVTAAQEQAQAAAADLQTARLSLQAELAIDYFELRSAEQQKQLLDETVKAYESGLRLATNRYEGGVAAKSDVTQAQTQLDTVRVQVIETGVQRAQLEHAIAVLTGRPPAALSIPSSQVFHQPPAVPGLTPAELLERRPDIAAMERRVAAANEQIGIAKAAFYPTVRLGAVLGLEGNSIVNWFTWPSRLWAVGPSMTQTLFDGGRRRATSEGVAANYDATVANYRETVLTAFQQVEDQLAALRILEQEAQQQQRAIESSQESLRQFTNRYQGGVDTYLQVVSAQTVMLANQRNAVEILRRRMVSSVLLIKALGGGWTPAELPKV